MPGKRALQNPRDPNKDVPRDNDLESGFGADRKKSKPKRRFPRFKDAVELAMEERMMDMLKQQLRAGVDIEEFERYRKSEEEIKAIKNKKVRQFYERQNERLNDWLEVDTIVEAMADQVMDSMNPDADHDGIIDRPGRIQDVGGRIEELLPDEDQENRKRGLRNARWAINVNVIANILLLAAKAFATIESSSLSLIASLVDSALDLLCTVIVWTTNRLVAWRLHGLERRFPVGRRRLEPLGILVFSVIMIISFVNILQESVMKLYKGISGTSPEAATLPAVAIASMAATVVIKGIIWFGCIRVKTTQVQALAQDCKTDVYFNTLSLLFPLIGHQAHVWWLDPVGAALLSLFIIYDWTDTCFQNVTRLCGAAVDDSLQKKLTFLAYRFSPLVNGFKSITAYHAGDGVWVEYDVLLDEKTPLRRAHDIAETLQYCCEGLDEVDRAFVTTDYSKAGPTGHGTS